MFVCLEKTDWIAHRLHRLHRFFVVAGAFNFKFINLEVLHKNYLKFPEPSVMGLPQPSFRLNRKLCPIINLCNLCNLWEICFCVICGKLITELISGKKKARRVSGLNFLRLGESSHNRVPSTEPVHLVGRCVYSRGVISVMN